MPQRQMASRRKASHAVFVDAQTVHLYGAEFPFLRHNGMVLIGLIGLIGLMGLMRKAFSLPSLGEGFGVGI